MDKEEISTTWDTAQGVENVKWFTLTAMRPLEHLVEYVTCTVAPLLKDTL